MNATIEIKEYKKSLCLLEMKNYRDKKKSLLHDEKFHTIRKSVHRADPVDVAVCCISGC
jgi:hypothetical protein